jgi:hypothetical protein
MRKRLLSAKAEKAAATFRKIGSAALRRWVHSQIGRRLSQSRAAMRRGPHWPLRVEIVDLVKNPQLAYEDLSSGRANVNRQAIRSVNAKSGAVGLAGPAALSRHVRSARG